ncbi:hypothetical protein ASPZODRAFT_56112 [Penicilliopsis zonata CBS 506.65]|uniref:Enoyl reductase (ER) domain-containing protein n=1 Tax=Penicilliopsis zonata CBS 506.65 TaxID=1073090 RepID=A0A1L9SXF4_9EURO|nr:hypothetical protein ASPZODRAFT_56112 [Penicilliopsis zonata CBS 506.65]OJJ51829.1 hypothetical protein ASPZODRAFT_56112 [Penicilliopsis zonata CBS 506.65]
MSTAAWVLTGQNGIDSLEFVADFPIPAVKEDEVLVKICAASLNYRELLVSKGGPGLALGKDRIVPGSDGAGIVQAVGSKVTGFSVGDRVCTHLTYKLPAEQQPRFLDISAGIGNGQDGTLRESGVFHQSSLVQMPANLTFLEAATLSCSGLTAWNALFGLPGRGAAPGTTVLVQGTGGVSIAALQLAAAAGATVIATTSTAAKAARLQALGAAHVLNYRETADWGAQAKALTPGARGVDIVVDMGGMSTLGQSIKAVCTDGLIVTTGILGPVPEGEAPPSLLDPLFNSFIARGFFLGSRAQFDEMNRFIEQHDIKPILDEKIFDIASVKDAYLYLKDWKHFSKIGIKFSD